MKSHEQYPKHAFKTHLRANYKIIAHPPIELGFWVNHQFCRPPKDPRREWFEYSSYQAYEEACAFTRELWDAFAPKLRS